jgi:UDP-N-acetylmuramoyl-L-alanyl-D-glutamate--2,6-diaminopimelate ligase
VRLSDLMMATLQGVGEIEITGLSADSRYIEPGFLFAALPGTNVDGAEFVSDAIENGAAAVLALKGRLPDDLPVPVVESDVPRRDLSLAAARFYARQPDNVMAVTGTSGKTSVAEFTRQILAHAGRNAASLGTLGVITGESTTKLQHTTPDPVSLYANLRQLADSGVTDLVLEASSHGLDQFRLDGIRPLAAAFTNLSRDHLDYHLDEESYFAAKARLFEELLPAGATAILPERGGYAERLAAISTRRGLRVLTYGCGDVDLRLVDACPEGAGQRLVLDICGVRGEWELPLVGAFQAQNILCAIGLALSGGIGAEQVLDAVGALNGVPGRLELAVETAEGAAVYVDYSHKPDALATALAALRRHTGKRLIVVFGCGGDRDAGKRPIMGEIAARDADAVIVTDDNPRSENPAEIRRQILAGCPGADNIGDRRDAIRLAVSRLAAGDVLLIAGKGHEQGQEAKGVVRAFDDRDEARDAVAALAGGRT